MMVNLKTDKSVRWMEWEVYNPRVKTRGYPKPFVNRVRVNPLIHQWDRPTRAYDLSSVSMDYSYLKTDESVGMTREMLFDSRVKMRGYPESRYYQFKHNPPIYRWGNTLPTHNLSSVLTAVSYTHLTLPTIYSV